MVPWHHGVMVPWYHGNIAPWYHGAMVPWYHGTTVLWYHGAMAPWHRGTRVPWYHDAMVPWFHGATMPRCQGATVSGTKGRGIRDQGPVTREEGPGTMIPWDQGHRPGARDQEPDQGQAPVLQGYGIPGGGRVGGECRATHSGGIHPSPGGAPGPHLSIKVCKQIRG